LNVSGLTNLEILRCQNNQLTSLDVTNNKKLRTLICFNNPSLNKVTGLEDLINLSVIDCNNTGLRPINLLRQQIREVFSTGANDSNGKNHDIGYRDLINKEIEACQQVNNTSVPLEDIPKSQREQAEQEQSAYEAKISQINPWLQ
jgi:Leucine-rich repeat (LRR) protein